METKLKAGIVGGSGFTGLELLKILNNHPMVEICFVTSRTYDGMDISEAFPSYNDKKSSFSGIKVHQDIKKLNFTDIDKIPENKITEVDVVFLCLPPLQSMEFINSHLSCFKGKIIDIGSDFRINDPADFKTWYGAEHKLKKMLPDFVYGLTEIYKKEIAGAQFVANPGCYPTSILLAMAPVLKNENLAVTDIIIDSKSGVTGAGRKLKPDYLFCTINENFFPYSILNHRHIGEIEQEIKKLADEDLKVSFTPHLLPVNRGIFTSIYFKVGDKTKNIAKITAVSGKGTTGLISSILKSYEEFYKDSIFVKFLGTKIPQLKDVVGTNMCQIGIALDDRTGILKIFSTIDNLLKGAAGQAVQNMNIMSGFNEAEGLSGYGVFS